VLVSPPVVLAELAVPKGLPALLITGDNDQIAPAEAVLGLAGPTVAVRVVSGADHSWWPGLDSLTAHAAAFARSLIS
jgi:hypothetical protein